MNRSQRRAWAALELGPHWVERGAVAPEPEPLHPVDAGPALESRARESVSNRREPAVPAANLASQPPPEVARASDAVSVMGWAQLRDVVQDCTRCGLCRSRTQTVFGSGSETSPWMIVGEAPGADEDARGEPFVGQAGRLLDNMLGALGLTRDCDAFVCNVLKCRPPANRNPEPGEVGACTPFLHRQVELLAPKGILVMGRYAAQALLGTDATIANLRGRVHAYRAGQITVPLVVTYHPAYLLRNLPDKAKAWADLCLARAQFGPGASGPKAAR